jgi:hypothetical protein
MDAETLSSAEFMSDELDSGEGVITATSEGVGSGVSANVSSLARVRPTSRARWMADLFDSGSGEEQSVRTKSLLSEELRRGDGIGPVVPLEAYGSKLLVVTLDITNVVERTGLTVSVWGSTDETEWGAKPLVAFRQRQYCGVYSVLLNLALRPEIQYVRVQWNMNRWGKTDRVPQFGFEVFVEESGARISAPAFA